MSGEYALCTVCTVRTGLVVPSRKTIIHREERRQYEGHNMPLGLDQFDSLESYLMACVLTLKCFLFLLHKLYWQLHT